MTENILTELFRVIEDRKANPKPNSYTCYLLEHGRDHIREKLREELEELLHARKEEEIIWEAADLIYHLLVYLASNEVSWSKVEKELRRRRREGR